LHDALPIGPAPPRTPGRARRRGHHPPAHPRRPRDRPTVGRGARRAAHGARGPRAARPPRAVRPRVPRCRLPLARPAVTARTGRVHPGPPAPAAHPARGDPQGRPAVVAGPGALRPARRPRPRRPRRRPGLRRAVPRPGRRAPRAPARTPARRPPAGAAAGPAAGLVEGSPMMRPAGDPTRPGWRSWAGVALLLQVLLVGAIALDVAETEPHKVPLAIVAPPVVADTLVDEVGQLPGEPFAPVAAASAQDARRALLAGEVRGVIVVDLAETVDTLLLDGEIGRASCRGCVWRAA